CGRPVTAVAVLRDERTTGGAVGAGNQERRWVEVAGPVALPPVVGARYQPVELDTGPPQRPERTHRRDQLAGGPRRPHRACVAGGEIDGIDAVELGPRQRVAQAGPEALAHHRDGALGAGVQVDERSSLRLGAPRDLDPNAQRLQPSLGPAPEGIVAKRREEEALAGEPRQLYGGDRSASRRLLPRLERVHDLPGSRNALHPRELDPLDVPDDCHPHRLGSLTRRRRRPSRPRRWPRSHPPAPPDSTTVRPHAP